MRTYRFPNQATSLERSITAGSGSISGNSKKKASKPPSNALKQAMKHVLSPWSRRRASSIKAESAESSEPSTPNVMQFLTDVCPEDVLPKILAFAGPQKTAALSKINRVWRDVIADDWTWRVLCEELYKWTPDQAEPVSWKQYYSTNPVVPIDYPTIHKALTALSCDHNNKPYQSGDVRILVRPGRYCMPTAVTIRALKRTTQITVQGMRLPETFIPDDTTQGSFGCNDSRVSLVSQTRLRNEPLFRVIHGELLLKDLCLEHMSRGIGIWSGNAGIHLQPDTGEMIQPPPPVTVAKAALVLESVEVVSRSGRGIVVLGGAHAQIKDSYIHDCAATGLYVGRDGSRAALEAVDVTDNGMGNQRIGGIVGGHSGIYIDEAVVSISDCNVSRNWLSGIAVISPGRTELTLKTTDLLLNGTSSIQLENEVMERLVDHSGCQIDFKGSFSPRSTILMAEQRADDESEAWLCRDVS